MLPHQEKPALQIGAVLLLFVFLSFLFPYLPGHESDNSLWAAWSWHIRVHGLGKAYGSGTNYLPLYQWVMWLFGKLVGHPDHIGLRIGYLRCFTLAFDILGLWYAWKWMDRKTSFFVLLFFNLLNVAYAYNTVFWGQVDGIMTTLVFMALFFAHRQKMVWSSIFFLLALNMKLQAVIFLPAWGPLGLYAVVNRRSLKPVLYSLLAMAAVQALILLPFLEEKDGMKQVWDVVTHSMGMYPRVSMNAYNFWYWVWPQDPGNVNDATLLVGGLSCKAAGLLLFSAALLLALWPLLVAVWRKIRGAEAPVCQRQLWLACSLTAILFFFFNTQMHERYCHPAFLFLAAWSFSSRRFLPYLLFSLAYFLNMESVLQFLRLGNYHTLIFDPRFIAGLFFLLILVLFLESRKSAGRLKMLARTAP